MNQTDDSFSKKYIDKTEDLLKVARTRKKEIIDLDQKLAKFVIFLMGQSYYAFHGADVKEIRHFEKISFVPGCPDYIPGVINIRGEIESVLDLNEFIRGIPTLETSKTRIIIAEKRDLKSGILVDSVIDVLDLPLNDIKKPISTHDISLRDYLEGEIPYKDKCLVLLDIEKIFEKIIL